MEDWGGVSMLFCAAPGNNNTYPQKRCNFLRVGVGVCKKICTRLYWKFIKRVFFWGGGGLLEQKPSLGKVLIFPGTTDCIKKLAVTHDKQSKHI